MIKNYLPFVLMESISDINVRFKLKEKSSPNNSQEISAPAPEQPQKTLKITKNLLRPPTATQPLTNHLPHIIPLPKPSQIIPPLHPPMFFLANWRHVHVDQ